MESARQSDKPPEATDMGSACELVEGAAVSRPSHIDAGKPIIRLPDEWEGRGTIAHITDRSLRRFLSLPPEVHHRLQRASAQLTAEQMIVRRRNSPSSGQQPPLATHLLSAVHQYELARFELDNLAAAPPTPPPPPPKERPLIRVRCKPKAEPREIAENPYLHYIITDMSTWSISRSSLELMEEFRITLCRWTLDAVIDRLRLSQPDPQSGPVSVALQCFGSYRSGYALAESEMDLIVVTENLPAQIQRKLSIILAQAFLSHGLAPYLLPSVEDDRSMVLRVCQNPSRKFIDMLEWEYPDLETAEELKTFAVTPLACCRNANPSQHYNIYFDRLEPLLRRTDLLRAYRICDNRVYEMALIVKRWAKARNINNPYHGTLSSYGYTLMLLHYLMNIAYPPVIPNLHKCKRYGSTEDNEETFWRNPRQIAREAARGKLTFNDQSTLSLLRGFFAYYSGPCHDIEYLRRKPRPWFHWKDAVVSIRERCSKTSKNWTTYHKDENGNIHRHLLAIEDPIKRDENVARMVTLLGVYLIREEFTRAFRIINLARPVPGTDLAWQTEAGERCEDLFAERVKRSS
ncbi:putative RNA uridylyltransferase [Microsporum audouinii]